jgi:predicted Zn-dependent protease
MKWSLSSRLTNIRARPAVRYGLLAILVLIAAHASPLWPHSDLLLQIEELNAEISVQPDKAELLIKRGDLHRRHQDYAAAGRDFEAARQVNPALPMLDFYQGRLLLETGDWPAAVRILSRYLEAHPEHAGAWVLRGEARMKLNRPLPAAGDFGQAINHSKNPSPELYIFQALALVDSGSDHWDEARQIVDGALTQFPGEVSLLGLGTDITLAQNRPGEARRYINTLPEALTRLPQWQRRAASSQCLTKGKAENGDEMAHCLDEIRARLSTQAASQYRT